MEAETGQAEPRVRRSLGRRPESVSSKLDPEYNRNVVVCAHVAAESLGDHLTSGEVVYRKSNPTARLSMENNGFGRATGRSARTVSGSSTNGSADWKHLVSRDA